MAWFIPDFRNMLVRKEQEIVARVRDELITSKAAERLSLPEKVHSTDWSHEPIIGNAKARIEAL